MKINPKNLVPIIIFVAVLAIIILGGLLFSKSKNLIQNNFPLTIITPNEIKDVPIYPGATFVKKENTPTCLTQSTRELYNNKYFHNCDTVQYRFTIPLPETSKKIKSWYINDDSKSGWKYNGDDVVGTDSWGFIYNENENKIYWLEIDEHELDEKKTRITLDIRIPLSGEYWKTYINTKYGFSFRYPDEWTETMKNDEKSFLVLPTEPDCELSFNCDAESISIDVMDNSNNVNLRDFAQEHIHQWVSEQPSYVLTDSLISIGDELKKRFNASIPNSSTFDIVVPGECGKEIFLISRNRKIIKIETNCATGNYTILSTFKFTN